MEKANANSVDFALLHRNVGLPTDRGVSRPSGVAFYVPDLQLGRVVATWSGFLIFIDAGAFVFGRAIPNEATAQQPAPPPGPIYYSQRAKRFRCMSPARTGTTSGIFDLIS